ncbi:hypothetical protein LPJ56_005858, partial [Coemansia sp. RSA 2599]
MQPTNLDFDLSESLLTGGLKPTSKSTADKEGPSDASRSNNALDALNKADSVPTVAQLMEAAAQVFPDSLDDGDFLADETSGGLMLLPNAQYLDEEEEEEGYKMEMAKRNGLGSDIDRETRYLQSEFTNDFYPSLDQLSINVGSEADEMETNNQGSQFSLFSDARVVRDPQTGEMVLKPHSELETRLPGHNDSPLLQREDGSAETAARYARGQVPQTHAEQIEDAARQGRLVANIIKSDALRKDIDEREALSKQSLAVFSASERYSAYKVALERKAQYDEQLAANNKRQKKAREQETPQQPAAAAAEQTMVSATGQSSAGTKSQQQQRGFFSSAFASKYALPPEDGEFITSRTSSGRSLYFSLRSEIDAAKSLDKLASLRGEDRMSS